MQIIISIKEEISPFDTILIDFNCIKHLFLKEWLKLKPVPVGPMI